MLKGRQNVRLAIEFFATDRHIDQRWQIEDLDNLDYTGDANMGTFRYIFHKLVNCLKGEIQTSSCASYFARS